MIDALDAVVREQLWQVRRPFEFFAEFAIASPPIGLGVRSLPPLKMLRYALLANGNFAHWTELLERTAREPGRPQQKLVKARLLCELFKVMAPNAQCTFIARVIEPRLDAGLAQRWRKRERIHAHTRRLRAKFKKDARACGLHPRQHPNRPRDLCQCLEHPGRVAKLKPTHRANGVSGAIR